MTDGTALPDEWEQILDECDLTLATVILRALLETRGRDGQADGDGFYDPAAEDALHAFIANPDVEHATRLLSQSPIPSLWQVFEMCRERWKVYGSLVPT